MEGCSDDTTHLLALERPVTLPPELTLRPTQRWLADTINAMGIIATNVFRLPKTTNGQQAVGLITDTCDDRGTYVPLDCPDAAALPTSMVDSHHLEALGVGGWRRPTTTGSDAIRSSIACRRTALLPSSTPCAAALAVAVLWPVPHEELGGASSFLSCLFDSFLSCPFTSDNDWDSCYAVNDLAHMLVAPQPLLLVACSLGAPPVRWGLGHLRRVSAPPRARGICLALAAGSRLASWRLARRRELCTPSRQALDLAGLPGHRRAARPAGSARPGC